MDNNKIQAHRPSAVNRYLDIARATKTPLAIHFADGEVIPSCIILEMDTLNLLIKTVDLTEVKFGEDSVVTRASIKRITPALDNHNN
jgi:hypothetical protein